MPEINVCNNQSGADCIAKVCIFFLNIYITVFFLLKSVVNCLNFVIKRRFLCFYVVNTPKKGGD